MSQVMKKGSGKEHEVCRTTPFRRVASTARKKVSMGPAQRRRRCQTIGRHCSLRSLGLPIVARVELSSKLGVDRINHVPNFITVLRIIFSAGLLFIKPLSTA